MESDKKRKKIIMISVLLIILAAGIVTGALIYNKYYKAKYEFKGLGDIYKSRNKQYRLFTERKITFGNKGNPPKSEIRALPSFVARFSTNLSDGSYLTLALDFRFSKAKGIKEIRRKWERIQFATTIALSAYSGKDFKEKDKEEVLVIIENQIRKRIFSEIKYIYLDKFELRG